MFDETLKEQSFNTYTFSNQDNKFILLLQKGIYPYKYMDHWGKFNRRSLPEKLNFYSQQNMKDNIYANCMHQKRVCKYFDRKILEEYHDLYVQSNILLLADVFQDLRNMCLKIYQLDSTCFPTATGLAWQVALRKTKADLDIWTDIYMLLMVEKGVSEKICDSVYWYAKASKKYMKDYDQNKESPHLQYRDVNYLK